MPQTKHTKPRGKLLEQLPYKLQMRVIHAGKWVAWTPNFKKVIAADHDPMAARAKAHKAGVAHPVMEWVPPVPERPVETIAP